MNWRCGLAVSLAILLGGCAHVEAPPGGPEDLTAPALVVVEPDSFAIVPDFDGRVVFRFDERVSEQNLQDAVSVSPRTSTVQVDHGGSTVRISLREGWVTGTIYHVALGTGVRDLFGNALTEPIELIFSTGPEIPETRLSGSVVDRITLEPESALRVEAIRVADSLVYTTVSDSIGEFVLQYIPPGDYLVRAFEDANRNRALDVFEPRDSARASVTGDEEEGVRLAVVMPDSTSPVLANLRVLDEVLELEFDDYLDPRQDLDPGSVSLQAPTGRRMTVIETAIGELPQPDTATAEPQTDTAAVQQEPDPADTLQLPSRTLSIRMARGTLFLPDAHYTLHIPSVVNVVGLSASVDTVFVGPQREPEPDTLDAGQPMGDLAEPADTAAIELPADEPAVDPTQPDTSVAGDAGQDGAQADSASTESQASSKFEGGTRLAGDGRSFIADPQRPHEQRRPAVDARASCWPDRFNHESTGPCQK